jgi:hypothetical protein
MANRHATAHSTASSAERTLEHAIVYIYEQAQRTRTCNEQKIFRSH